VIRRLRPWVAAACVLCWGAETASADGLRWSSPSYSQKVETSPAESPSNTPGWILLASGVALDVGSFVLAGKADDYYRDYQSGTDPATLAHHYDQAVKFDRLASGTLILGQVAIGAGLYLLLIKHPKNSDDSGSANERRLGLSYRATGAGPGGLALTMRF
jgi:hypothetical protein